MPKIFISYSSKDKAFVIRLATDLERLGADLWMDSKNIPAGEKWASAIQVGLDQAEIMILVISPNSMGSQNVEDEWQYFHQRKRLIIPVLLEPAKIHYQLNGFERIDFHRKKYEDSFQRLQIELERKGITLESHLEQGITTRAIRTFPKSFSLPLLEWIDIPLGSVTLEGNGGTYDVEPFAISKYPVTNGQFNAFIDDKAYENDRWWVDLAKRIEVPKMVPSSDANNPRQYVSWYEAIAFCRWLADKIGVEVTLPTEMQWQWAALGRTGWAFPYGPNFDKEMCNSRESGFGKSTPVNYYDSKVQGKTPFGVMDMSGNVWEWCLNTYDNPKYIDTDDLKYIDSKRGLFRAVRGGSWFNNQPNELRASKRAKLEPFLTGGDYGFRCVRSSQYFFISAY